MDRISARHATLICANSLYSRESIYRAYGVYPRLNYLGVDTEQFRPLNLKRAPVILSVGALHPAKGQDFILRSLGEVGGRLSVKFIFNFAYGPDHYQNALQELANRLGVVISFERLASDEALVTAYNQAAMTAYPSRLEPLGLVPLESMACGTPVVGFAEGGVRETVQHGVTGLLTENDEKEFAGAIKRLIDDDRLREQMGRNGRAWVAREWNWEKAYSKLEENMKRIYYSNS